MLDFQLVVVFDEASWIVRHTLECLALVRQRFLGDKRTAKVVEQYEVVTRRSPEGLYIAIALPVPRA